MKVANYSTYLIITVYSYSTAVGSLFCNWLWITHIQFYTGFHPHILSLQPGSEWVSSSIFNVFIKYVPDERAVLLVSLGFARLSIIIDFTFQFCILRKDNLDILHLAPLSLVLVNYCHMPAMFRIDLYLCCHSLSQRSAFNLGHCIALVSSISNTTRCSNTLVLCTQTTSNAPPTVFCFTELMSLCIFNLLVVVLFTYAWCVFLIDIFHCIQVQDDTHQYY